MKSFTAIAALAALSSTYAATVTLQETACLQNTTTLETFTIDTDVLVVKELKSVCGLQLVSASGVSVGSLTCQAYKDAEGKEKGSAEFTFASPALIATNPVQEGAILCKSAKSNTTDTSAPVITSTAFVTLPVSSGAAASSGSAIPTSRGGNATVTAPTAPTVAPTGPSATASGTAAPTGAASHVGFSVGAMAAAFAVLLL